MNGRLWTTEDEEYLCRWYRQKPAIEIARHLGRSRRAVHVKARQFGLTITYPGNRPGLPEFVREKYAEGLCDRDIAVLWGCERHTIGDVRRRLKLGPPNSHERMSVANRDRVREKTARYLAQVGCRSMGELRAKSFREYALANGWPEDLRPRAVQILNCLAYALAEGVLGLTRPQICEAIGMRWKGSRKSLTSNDQEGSYLAHLVARGLVVRHPRAATVTGQGRGRSLDLYTLSPEAISILEEHCEQQRLGNDRIGSAEDQGTGYPVSPAG